MKSFLSFLPFSFLLFSFFLLNADPITIAEDYRDLLWLVQNDNVINNYTSTGNPQDGYTDDEPCDWIDLVGEHVLGMPYHYGGRDDFDEWNDDYVNGSLGPGGHSVHYPGSLNWAAGIDCSGFVGRCWEIDNYTLHMYFNTSYIASNYEEVSVADLQPGDCFVKPGVHCRLFYQWGTDNNVITIEATSGSYDRVLQYEYDLYQDIISQGYVLRRNVPVSVGNEIQENVINLSNYPNPFNPSTTISFDLAAKDTKNAKIEIYNLKGQKIKTLPVILSDAEHCIEGSGSPNSYSVVWNGTDNNNNPVSSGIYLYRLKAGNVDVSLKCLLLK